MTQPGDISAELQEISATVAGIKKSNPFDVPHNYFAEFPGEILAVIRQTEAGSISPKDEIELISPLLASLKNKQTLTIPQNYFEQLNLPGIEVEEQKEAAVLAPVRPIFNSKKWMQYAAVAAFTGLIGWGMLMFFNNSAGAPGNDGIRQNELAADRGNNQPSEGLKELPDDVLDEYLAEMPDEPGGFGSAAPAFFNLAIVNIDDKALADLLHEISDEDLQSFEEDNRDYLAL